MRRAIGARRHDACSSSSTTATCGNAGACGSGCPAAVGDLPPGGLLRLDVVAGAPDRLPAMHAPFELGARELALVRIEMNRVRVDPHAELAASVGLREEPRLQSHRQQRERLIAPAQALTHQRRQRRIGARQREARSEQRGGHGRLF